MSTKPQNNITLEPWEDEYTKAVKITLKLGNISCEVSSLGATLLSFKYPDKTGKVEEITLNYREEDPSQYAKKNKAYYGSTVGRFANRIAGGNFSLEGRTYKLAKNNGENHLHGGVEGFDKKVWDFELLGPESDDIDLNEASTIGVKFKLHSKDMEEGYPGNIHAEVKYIINVKDQLHIIYRATTDKATILNMTNHTYWNLSGNFKRSAREHRIKLFCSYYLPIDGNQIPTGEIKAVDNSPFDLRSPKHSKGIEIGPRLSSIDDGGQPGYDHCFVIDGKAKSLRDAAIVRDTQSGRKMTVQTNQAGIQFYTANFLSRNQADFPHCQHQALCLETEHYPDSPNQAKFPSPILNPEDVYYHHTTHTFSCED